MNIKALNKDISAKMDKTVTALENEFRSINAGRANPALLERISADYYGVPTPINQMAAIQTPDARTLLIQPWDKSSMKLITKAIQASDIGINPTDDGSVIRLVFPAPTEERRKELCKKVSKMGEEAKVAIRNIRRDFVDLLKAQKKNSEITEDEQKEGEKEVQNVTDNYIKTIDKMVKDKENEVLSI